VTAVAVHVRDEDVVAAGHGDTVVLVDNNAVADGGVVRACEIEAWECQIIGHSMDYSDVPSLLCDAGRPFDRSFGAYPALLFSVMWWMSMPALLLILKQCTG
jgi:hypothetical protein